MLSFVAFQTSCAIFLRVESRDDNSDSGIMYIHMMVAVQAGCPLSSFDVEVGGFYEAREPKCESQAHSRCAESKTDLVGTKITY